MTRLDAVVTAVLGVALLALILTSETLARLVHAVGVCR
jgi:hypothetical protein